MRCPGQKEQPRRKAFRLTTLFGVQVRIDFSWFIVFGLVLWTLSAGYYPRTFPYQAPITYWLMGLASALLLFSSVLAHELSHALTARRYGINVRRITLFIFGGVAEIPEEPSEAKTELKIALAGPLCSVALAVLFWITSLALTSLGADAIYTRTFDYLASANLMLVIFNMIPGFPLDGGRVLRAYLWHRRRDIKSATKTATRIGEIAGVLFIILGLLQILSQSLIGGIWMIFIGMFLRQTSATAYRMTVMKEGLRGLKVAQLMNASPVTIDAAETLDALVQNYFYRSHHSWFPVERDGSFAGTIHINQVKQVPRNRWIQTRIDDIMTDGRKVQFTTPEEDGADLFNRISQTKQTRFPVVSGDKIVGVITLSDILHLLRILEAE